MNRKKIVMLIAGRRAAGKLATLAAGAGVGAGLMYLCDPNRGRARRRKLTDQASGVLRHDEHWMRKRSKDLMNRMQGVVSEASAALAPEENIPDDVLAERIRSRMGHVIGHPHDVNVRVSGGKVVLEGKLPRRDRARLNAEIEEMPGVTRIDDRTARRPFAGPALLMGLAAGLVLLRKPSAPAAGK